MRNLMKIAMFLVVVALGFSAIAAEKTTTKQPATRAEIAKTVKNSKAVKAKTAKTTKKAEPKKADKKAEDKPAEGDKVVVEPQQKFVRKFEKWDLFKIVDNSTRTCFISTTPESEKGTFKKRSNPYLLVTYRGRGTPEISISSGYNYLTDSFVEVAIDAEKKYNFFTSDKTPKVAWAKDAKADAEIINEMKKGTKFVASATSTANTTSQDTYSLKGFKQAFEGVLKFCK